MASRELSLRLGVAAVGIPLVLGLIYLGGWPLGVFIALLAGQGTREFYELASASGVRPFTFAGMGASTLVVLLATAYPTVPEAAPLAAGVLMVLTLAGLAASLKLRWPDGEPMAAVSVTVAGVLYVGFPLAFVPVLRWLPATAPGALTGNAWHATAFLLFPIVVIWMGDSAAYFGGRAFGRTRLAPDVSPGKTVEGALLGLVGSVAGAGLVSWWALSRLPFLTVPVATALWMGLLVGVAGQLGDLTESVLKREAGVKDSGRLLPGHGGVLDRTDSLVFGVPLTWLLLRIGGVLP